MYNLPEEPPIGLLESMATCLDHSFGLWEEYLKYPENHILHKSKRQRDNVLSDMRKLYDEVAGVGYFNWEKSNEPRNCPFCGAEAFVGKWQMSNYWTIGCSNVACACNTAFQNRFESKEKAISFWNGEE